MIHSTLENRYDVIVIGGGTAGTVAAIQAARAGASTLLVEKNGMLGGTMTTAGVTFPGLFYAFGKQVIAGIGWELVTESVELAGDTLPDFSGDYSRAHWRFAVPIAPALWCALADDACIRAGVRILFHSMPAGVQSTGDGWEVTVCMKEGLQPIRCGVLIDCTGDANAVTQAGFAVVRHNTLQPGTIIVRTGGYDSDALDFDTLDTAVKNAVAEGRLTSDDLMYPAVSAAEWLSRRGRNAIHIGGIDASTSAGKTEAEIEARRALMRIYRFFRSLPGLENFHYEYVAPEFGVRETVTIAGKKTITVEDYAGGVMADDAVCYSFYPIDIHLSGGEKTDIRPLPDGVVPTIPRGAMLPADSDRLIVAGRCIAGDREANSAYRVEASCMATGQAAGAMATLSIKEGCTPEQLAIPAIHDMLREHGAIIPGEI